MQYKNNTSYIIQSALSVSVTVDAPVAQRTPRRSRRAESQHQALQIYTLPYLHKTFFNP